MPRRKPEPIALRLFAPYVDAAAVIGSWNDWRPQPMTRDEQGWWRIALTVGDGDYAYQFVVRSKSYFMEGQNATVTDPRALRLDAQGNAILRVRKGRRRDVEYPWRHDDAPLPPNDHLVIYELYVADFSGGKGDLGRGAKGRIKNVTQKLEYLKSLGVNAIELMPCTAFPGERSWGYNPITSFAFANSYGTPEDLCQLVDECHARGMRVIHDGVYNHSAEDSPLAQIDYTYWYYRDPPDPPDSRFGPKFDYVHFDEHLGIFPARDYARDAVLAWIAAYHLDGIRFDATGLINNHDFLRDLHGAMHATVPGKPFITIAENIPQDPSVAGPDGPLDSAWHENFFQQVMATMVGREFEGHQPFDAWRARCRGGSAQ